jgi:hypothetical protein
MRFVSRIAGLIVVAVSLYFVLTWASEAVHAVASPNFGLDDPERGQGVRALARFLDLGPDSLVRLAAFLAAVKLTAAAVLALHLVGRVRASNGASRNDELLDAALLLVVVLTLVMAMPAVLDGNRELVRLYAADLLMAGAAAIFSVIERTAAGPPVAAEKPAVRLATSDEIRAPGRQMKRVSSWLWG